MKKLFFISLSLLFITNYIYSQEGLPGINCWDLNGNRINDLEEDKNFDGEYNALDCQGFTGQTGATGATGPPGGPRGEQGTPGASAYQIWLNLGNQGTEQDFINSIGTSNNSTLEYTANVQGGTYQVEKCCCPTAVDLSSNITFCSPGSSIIYAANEQNGTVILDGDGTAMIFFSDEACETKQSLIFDLIIRCDDSSIISESIQININ